MLTEGFMSTNIDFLTDGYHHEMFGAIWVDIIAARYDMEDDQSLFMSKEMKDKLDSSLFVTGKPILDNFEYALNFERFKEPKTISNVTKWMYATTAAARIAKEGIGRLSADGGSNAVRSVQEFEVVQREEGGGRSNNTDFVVCMAHQLQRSAGYASGTVKFASLPNEPLGAVLKKNHTLHVRMNASTGRVTAYRRVQEAKHRDPPLGVNPANEVRWDGELYVAMILW